MKFLLDKQIYWFIMKTMAIINAHKIAIIIHIKITIFVQKIREWCNG